MIRSMRGEARTAPALTLGVPNGIVMEKPRLPPRISNGVTQIGVTKFALVSFLMLAATTPPPWKRRFPPKLPE